MKETLERLARPPLEAVRESPFTLVCDANDAEGDGRTLDGYAAVFNRETIIDSWEGRFKEKIAPGAMKKSFRENPPIVQFDHGHHPLIGSIPIAAVRSIQEEVDPVRAPDGGAHIVARLEDNWLIDPIRDGIASGAIGGMSFRFGVVKEEWRSASGDLIEGDDIEAALMRTWRGDVPDDELPVRTLRELRVPELGPVVWPAYRDTSVGVRSREILTLLTTDPQVRAEVARGLAGTQPESSEAEGASDEERAAAPDEEPPEALPSAHVLTPQTRQRLLIMEGVLSDG